MSDDFTADRKIQVHLLIGLDFIWEFLNPLKCVRYESLIAQQSTFGWVISGYFTNNDSYANVKTQLCCFSFSDNDLKEFLGLEIAGVTPNEKRFCDEYGPIVQKFNETLKFENNKYTVNLIWKEPHVKLVNNLSIAIKRQTALEKHLVKDPELRQKYYNVFDVYESQSKIEEVPLNEINVDHRVYYLPHFPVIKDTRLSTKVRPVFDGSCKSFNDVSLNDALETGPALQLKIFSILLRFRRWSIGLFADVESAFHAINLNPVDQDVCRFLLPKSDGTFRHMRFRVLPFGLNCSPYLLNAVISHHLNKYPHTNTIHELQNNIYVDDFISGCDQIETAKIIHDEANEILLNGGLKLTKWATTDKRVQELVGCTKSDETFILGMKLNLEHDTFSFSQYDFSHLSVEFTKRVLLTLIAKPYDPNGMLSPFIMAGKIILQQIWRLGIGWDVILPDPFINNIHEWMQSTKHVHDFVLPRTYFPDVGWDSISNVEIHGFSDASLNGYGAVVYLIIHTLSGYKTAFVAAKGRSAPVQRMTIPRLELMSPVLCARLVDTIIYELELKTSNKTFTCYYWTDSEVSWHWIRSDPYTLKTFVSNRVSTIRILTSPSSWYHCPGSSNPADIISRGCLMDQLIASNFWLKGPSWLSQEFNVNNIPKKALENGLQDRINSEQISH